MNACQNKSGALHTLVASCRVSPDGVNAFQNKSGTLDKSELLRLAEVLWDTFYPNGPKIDAKTKEFMVHARPLSPQCARV